MADVDFPEPEQSAPTIEPKALKQRIDDGESVTLLDVRTGSDYEEWHIDGETVETINVPYYEFLDDDIGDGVFESIPDGGTVTVICAKGEASEYIAGVLKDRGYDAESVALGMNGWAEIYEAVEVSGYDGPGTVVQYQRPSSGCLGYLVVDDGEAAVIDPLRAFTDRYLDDAKEHGADLRYALDTHVHADHVSGIRALAEASVEAVLPAAAIDRGVEDADDLTGAEDGDVFTVGDVEIEAIHTPGHTTGMTSYLVGDALLATGDGLFVESVARPDLEAGDAGAEDAAQQLYETLQERILTLSDDVLIAGGHTSDAAEPAADGTYTATLGDLRAEMDALSMDEADFVELILADMPPRPANYEDIIATNLGQHRIDDEEAFSLELGPNNCAASQDSLAGD
ncbi:thiosulfate-3-mercaptopyruvate sulfurtransferase protein [Halorhabdus tiamatea SARL4B]|uniref:Thiosulfate-3-mercaptopyruvate sulfurtransferase protein n=1 Tax=Halorhabdus tiamatea SARL4B TaxID=1033806 RepID=F7PGH9_9EURY|nr:MBL fold metallo-hydrolase [Halorhabdus tiamatea]ERJ07755.1 thiosulfate-3-mercaptopyruvate sulfurtransferase protein [Halorhabdus tiamatea SARL4B]CCQ32586.1 Zn-dependent hydroxyacylglutathione hydrolase [Halorhabdus tiamatea SARL4B]